MARKKPNDRERDTKLWQAGGRRPHPLVERFTVGDDPRLDEVLAPYDLYGTAAHAAGLVRAGVLSAPEFERLRAALGELLVEAREGRFAIDPSHEDCHTEIELRLTRRLGEPGRKVHAGRSRNDQVLCALRLCTRQRLLDAAASALDLASALLDRARSERETPLPGFSHTRKAMPTTVGHYLAAFAEELLDGLETLDTAYRLNDRSPLGSAAGFGSRLPLDRDYVARLLGFSGVQHNTLAVQNSRGPLAALVLFGLTQLLAGCARLALDLILFSAPEPGFFSLPEELTTGSSLMPQKRNPDVLELIRGRAARVRSRLYEVLEISAPLYSGYHRDLQLTKEPLIRGLDDAGETLAVLTLVAEKLIVHRERCLAACTPDLFATDAALDLVLAGRPFREAYREVKADIESVRTPDVRRLLAAQTISGSPGNPGFDDLAGGIAGARKRWTVRRGATEKKLKALLDR